MGDTGFWAKQERQGPEWAQGQFLPLGYGVCSYKPEIIDSTEYSAYKYEIDGGNINVSPDGGTLEVGSWCAAYIGDFIAAQGRQSVSERADTDWLAVGHIDEVMHYLPDGEVAVASVSAALNLMKKEYECQGTGSVSGTSYTLADTAAVWAANEWSGGFVVLTSGTGAGQVRKVASNTGTVITLVSDRNAFSPAPASDTQYRLMAARNFCPMLFSVTSMYVGVATGTSGSNYAIIDSTRNWTTNQWCGAYVKIVAGTGEGQVQTVSQNNATSLSTGYWTTKPDATSVYLLVKGSAVSVASSGVTGLIPPLTPSDFFVVDRLRIYVDPQKVGLLPYQWWCDVKRYNEVWCASKCLSGSGSVLLPALFETVNGREEYRALALLPGMVNMLIVNKDGTRTAIVPKPFGPTNQSSDYADQTGDYFENAVRSTLLAHGVDAVIFVDTLDLHTLWGEIHCATQQSCELP
jgi:hypothetical protein